MMIASHHATAGAYRAPGELGKVGNQGVINSRGSKTCLVKGSLFLVTVREGGVRIIDGVGWL